MNRLPRSARTFRGAAWYPLVLVLLGILIGGGGVGYLVYVQGRLSLMRELIHEGKEARGELIGTWEGNYRQLWDGNERRDHQRRHGLRVRFETPAGQQVTFEEVRLGRLPRPYGSTLPWWHTLSEPKPVRLQYLERDPSVARVLDEHALGLHQLKPSVQDFIIFGVALLVGTLLIAKGIRVWVTKES
jgi:ribosomal protein L34